jgi:glutamate/tyrosine decarboxylase-like PLP-dependent enzyme
MDETRSLLRLTADLSAEFLDSLDERPVFPQVDLSALRRELGGPLPETPTTAAAVVTRLASAAERGIVAMPSGRYFGFVIGGSVPAALAADWLTSAWDQNAGLYVGGPAASVVEEVAGEWLKELLRLPPTASYGFVTGCQMAHVTALAAARLHVLRETGWDVNQDGLAGASPIRVLVGEKRHVTIDRALRLLGIGTSSLVPVAADDQGRLRVDALDALLAAGDGPTIVCAQAGEVNTGAFDPLPAIADRAAEAGAWLHVDGAFGLWAAASPRLAHLVEGAERADSWATDAHKWLNVPYDSGFAFCAHPEAHVDAMSYTAAYLSGQVAGRAFGGGDFTTESSRRARGFATWAALRALGRSGVAELVDRCCRMAQRFAERLDALAGFEVANDVVLNQVLVRVGDEELTELVARSVQEDGTCWLGATTWRGERLLRISVSNWSTTEADVDASVEAIRQARAAVAEASAYRSRGSTPASRTTSASTSAAE